MNICREYRICIASIFLWTMGLLATVANLHAQPARIRAPFSPVDGSREVCRYQTPVAVDAVAPLVNEASSSILPVRMASQKEDSGPGLAPPSPKHLFRLSSEQAFLDRLRQDLPNVKNVTFPKHSAFQAEVDRLSFPGQAISPVFSQVCYRPLYFEDKQTERFGRYIPCVQPLVSASKFYVGVLLLPCRMCIKPPWIYECDNR
jgi:hypothetical protein